MKKRVLANVLWKIYILSIRNLRENMKRWVMELEYEYVSFYISPFLKEFTFDVCSQSTICVFKYCDDQTNSFYPCQRSCKAYLFCLKSTFYLGFMQGSLTNKFYKIIKYIFPYDGSNKVKGG